MAVEGGQRDSAGLTPNAEDASTPAVRLRQPIDDVQQDADTQKRERKRFSRRGLSFSEEEASVCRKWPRLEQTASAPECEELCLLCCEPLTVKLPAGAV